MLHEALQSTDAVPTILILYLAEIGGKGYSNRRTIMLDNKLKQKDHIEQRSYYFKLNATV